MATSEAVLGGGPHRCEREGELLAMPGVEASSVVPCMVRDWWHYPKVVVVAKLTLKLAVVRLPREMNVNLASSIPPLILPPILSLNGDGGI